MFHTLRTRFRSFGLRLQATLAVLFSSSAIVAYPRFSHGREDFIVHTLPNFHIHHLGYAHFIIGKLLESQLLIAEKLLEEEEAIAENEHRLSLEAEAAVQSIKKILAED